MHSIPRLFVLRRDRDITGVSGAGDVADGVQWADGSVVLRWRERPSTSVWDGLDLMLSVHGHDGATRVVWADEDLTPAEAAAYVAEAYDVPAALLGTDVERAYLRRQLAKALSAVHSHRDVVTEAFQPDRYIAALANAAMPVVQQILAQRDRAQAAAGRAYQLADRWEAAHGSAYCLVRIAGAELREVLDEPSPDETDMTEAGIDHAMGTGTPVQIVTEHPAAHEASAADEDALRATRRNSLLNLLDRLDRTRTLTPEERTLLRQHVEAMICEANTAATQATDAEARCRLPHEMEA